MGQPPPSPVPRPPSTKSLPRSHINPPGEKRGVLPHEGYSLREPPPVQVVHVHPVDQDGSLARCIEAAQQRGNRALPSSAVSDLFLFLFARRRWRTYNTSERARQRANERVSERYSKVNIT